MSLVSQINDLTTRISQEFKAIRASLQVTGTLEAGVFYAETANYSAADASVIQLKSVNADSKPWITWYDHNGDRIAGIVAHERQGGTGPTGPLHQHISIETADSLGQLQTRFEVQYGADKVEVGVKSANFKVGAGNDFLLGTTAGVDSNAILGNGTFYKYGTGNVGFGDKDWAADGVFTGAK
jgi:hypothetical protein